MLISREIKDFQCATAERILHIYKNLGHRRVLLADEVGLGKTYVAKQVINLIENGISRNKMISLRLSISVLMLI